MEQYLTPDKWVMIVRTAFLVFVVVPMFFLLCKWIRKHLSKVLSLQQGMVIAKIVQYLGLSIIFIMVFKELGFSLTPLLGAAGIVGVALGFASQTSVSNIISGIFLIIEEPFSVGEVIMIGATTGTVLSIDFLSIKLRTFDNKFVRIPNEALIKGEITNLTRFPIRRADLKVSIAYKEDVTRVKELLEKIAFDNPLCLQEPQPLIIFLGFNASSIDLQFSVWSKREDFLKLKNTMQEEIKNRFDKEDVEIPFPHTSIYTGQATKPFPIQILGQDKKIDERTPNNQ